jgi:hypothetical protein
MCESENFTVAFHEEPTAIFDRQHGKDWVRGCVSFIHTQQKIILFPHNTLVCSRRNKSTKVTRKNIVKDKIKKKSVGDPQVSEGA